MIIRPYESGDIKRIIVRNELMKEWAGSQKSDVALCDTYCFTAVHHGEVIAIAGFFQRFEGICDIWALFSDRASEFRFSIVKAILKHIKALKEFGFHCFTTPVRKSDEVAIRFIEALKFNRCGELNKYLWKEDFWLYSLGD
jgi:RimJ/RimL family protein N-acetyltransferase